MLLLYISSHKVCKYEGSPTSLDSLIWPPLEPGGGGGVDSIAVSVFVVILVDFDKYKYISSWDEQACLLKSEEEASKSHIEVILHI